VNAKRIIDGGGWAMRKALITILLLATTEAQQAVDLIRADVMKAQMYFLASDDLQGRNAGSHEGRIVADYIASEFMQLGLEPVGDAGTYFQNFETVRATVDPVNTTLQMRRPGSEKTFMYAHDFDMQWVPESNNPEEVTAGVLFAGYGIDAPEYGYADLKGIDLRGHIALVLAREPQASDPNSRFKGKWDTLYAYPWHKVEQLRRAGAAGVLIINTDKLRRPERIPSAPADYMQPGPRYGQGLLTGLWDLPVFSVTPQVANELLASTASKVEELQKEIDRTYRPHSFVIPNLTVTMKKVFTNREILHTRNVMGLLRGTDPAMKDEVVTITGHYDHGGVLGNRIYSGADDNASGTVGVLDCAEAYVRGNVRHRRTILFIVFDAEERGLLGSFHYVDHPVIALDKTVANLNMDMIGRDEESTTWHTTADQNRNSVNIVGTLYNPDIRHVIEAANKDVGLKLDFKTDTDDPEVWFARSDHFGFAEKSIPMVLFNTGEQPDYHTENDTSARINYPKMEKIVRLVFLSSLQVANAEQRPKFIP
jgi:hypothetical protein